MRNWMWIAFLSPAIIKWFFFSSQRFVRVFHCYWNMVGTFNDHILKYMTRTAVRLKLVLGQTDEDWPWRWGGEQGIRNMGFARAVVEADPRQALCVWAGFWCNVFLLIYLWLFLTALVLLKKGACFIHYFMDSHSGSSDRVQLYFPFIAGCGSCPQRI